MEEIPVLLRRGLGTPVIWNSGEQKGLVCLWDRCSIIFSKSVPVERDCTCVWVSSKFKTFHLGGKLPKTDVYREIKQQDGLGENEIFHPTEKLVKTGGKQFKIVSPSPWYWPVPGPLPPQVWLSSKACWERTSDKPSCPEGAEGRSGEQPSSLEEAHTNWAPRKGHSIPLSSLQAVQWVLGFQLMSAVIQAWVGFVFQSFLLR